ncbi:MAG: hypothetical protein ACRDFX_12330 [Chloroflexota bacterium]
MIFIDRSIPKDVALALRYVRSDVKWLEDEFPHDAPDEIWLKSIGERGWLAVTRDKKVRTRPGERAALAVNRVGCFVLVQKQPLTKWHYLKLLALTLDDMERIFAATERPFLYGVGRTCRFTRIDRSPAPC